MFELSVWKLVLVALVVLVLFGRGKVADFMGEFGKGIQSFKKGLSDDEKPAQPQPSKLIEQSATPTVEQKAHDEQKIGG
jgi:sec-independent protein translocase protein TatA